MSLCGQAPALRWLQAMGAPLLLLLLLGFLAKGEALSTCGVVWPPTSPPTCALGQGPASASTPCTTCDAADCCKPVLSWVTVVPSPNFTPARWEHCMVTVNGQLLVIAGSTIPLFNAKTDFLNDVWASPTGTAWVQRTAAAAFSPRAWLGCVTLGSSAVVIAGYNGGGDLGDVWSSADSGVTFTQLTAQAAFGLRSTFGAVVFKNMAWLIAGWHNYTFYNDVWYSSDAATWVQMTVIGAIFSPRDGVGIAVYKDQIWIVGGENINTVLTDVWSTVNGAVWTSWAQVVPMQPRGFGVLVVFTASLWYCGGEATANSTVAYPNCWASLDGKAWVAQPALPGPLMGQQAAVVAGGSSLLLTGGNTGTALVSTSYLTAGAPSCVAFTCPANLQAFPSTTVCAGATCAQADCCSSSLGARSTKILVIVLAVPVTAFTPVSFAAAAAAATGLQVQSFVVTAMVPSSLTIYVAVLGTTPALADAGLALLLQAALTGVFGPVVTVYLTDSPTPPLTTYPAYPTVPVFRAPSTSNPALLALLTLLVIPLAICLGLICSYARRPTCMPACSCPGQPMMMA